MMNYCFGMIMIMSIIIIAIIKIRNDDSAKCDAQNSVFTPV